MPRYAKKSSTYDLKDKIVKLNDRYAKYEYDEDPDEVEDLNYVPRALLDSVTEDFKVKFDFENHYFQCRDKDFYYRNDNKDDRCGLIQVGDFAICLAWAGGDWEQPVHFAIYLSDKGKLRVYIPTKGNTFNPWTKMAIGDESQAKIADIRKMPSHFFNKDISQLTDEELREEVKYDDCWSHEFCKWHDNGIDPDFDAMLEDIKERIQVKK